MDYGRPEQIRKLRPVKCHIGNAFWDGYVVFEFGSCKNIGGLLRKILVRVEARHYADSFWWICSSISSGCERTKAHAFAQSSARRVGKPVQCLVLIAEDGDRASDNRDKAAYDELCSRSGF
jgi:hypothetical protein